MKIFIKRFWGFDVNWPIVSFSQRGSLKALLDQSGSGDLMAFVGTLGPNTPAANERGRLLGLAEFGRTPIHSRTALPEQSFATAPKGPDGDLMNPLIFIRL